MSCTANPRYTEYWPIVAAAWLKLGVTPVCLFIPDNPTHKLPKAPGGIVHTIPPLEDVHIVIQGSMLRFWGSCLYPKNIVIITDIDMAPLSKKFFWTRLAQHPEDAYLHLRHDPGEYPFYNTSRIPEKRTRITEMRYLNACFHVAKGAVMRRILELGSNWETTCKKTLPYYIHNSANAQRPLLDIKVTGRPPYDKPIPRYGDEIYPSIRLHHSTYPSLFYITYQPDEYPELITYSTVFTRNVKQDMDYVGVHLPLPYAECKEIVTSLVTKGRLPKSDIILRRLIDLTTYPGKRIAGIGIWLSLILMGLVWFMLRPFAPFGNTMRISLIYLWYKRQELLTLNPLVMRLYRRWLRTRKNFFSKPNPKTNY